MLQKTEILKIGGAIVTLAIITAVLYPQLKSHPIEFSLNIPFTTQAPDHNWFNNKNCEEASLVMANSFLSGTKDNFISRESADKQIQDLIAWEQLNLGHNEDTGALETARMAEEALNLNTELIYNFSKSQLKNALLKGKVVLLPIDAQLLDPSTYQLLKPLYHMVVLRGYNPDGFWVNDPGTSSGFNQFYTFDKLKDVSADWDSAAKRMDPTTKIAIVISK